MATKFEIMVAPDGRCDVRFPEHCTCCGAAHITETPLSISKSIMRKRRQSQLTVRLRIPHCQACARSSDWLFWISFIPALLGFLVVGGIVLVAVTLGGVWLGLDTYGRSQDSPSLVLGAFFGLLAGLVGGLLAEAIARLILWPFLGRAMLRAPLFVVKLLTDEEYVAGLQGALVGNGAHVRLTFENDAIAHEFANLNGITPSPHGSTS